MSSQQVQKYTVIKSLSSHGMWRTNHTCRQKHNGISAIASDGWSQRLIWSYRMCLITQSANHWRLSVSRSAWPTTGDRHAPATWWMLVLCWWTAPAVAVSSGDLMSKQLDINAGAWKSISAVSMRVANCRSKSKISRVPGDWLAATLPGAD